MKSSWGVCGECGGRKQIRPTVCDNCGEPLKTYTYLGGVVEPQDILPIRAYGGYGFFFDHNEEPETLYFCHDCCVKLFIAFPAFERAYGDKGLHPYEDIPCCKYGWTFETRDGVEGTQWGDGTWEPHKGCPGSNLQKWVDEHHVV